MEGLWDGLLNDFPDNNFDTLDFFLSDGIT